MSGLTTNEIAAFVTLAFLLALLLVLLLRGKCACKFGLEGIVLEAQGFRHPFRALPRLAQNEERKCTGREARSRRGME